MKSLLAFPAIFAAVLLLHSAARGDTISLNPIADSFLTAGSADPDAGSPTGNYGGAGALMISGATTTKGEIQTLLKFQLTAANLLSLNTAFPDGWMISSITLQLGTNTGTQGVPPMNLIFNKINAGLFNVNWQANDNWLEGNGNPMNPSPTGVNYNSLAGLENSALDELLGSYTYTPVGNTGTGVPPTPPPATYGLGVDPAQSSGFLADLSSGGEVSLRLSAGDSTVAYLFNSRTFSSNKPTLMINAVAAPEPSSTFLLLGAGAVLALGQRKRHARLA